MTPEQFEYFMIRLEVPTIRAGGKPMCNDENKDKDLEEFKSSVSAIWKFPFSQMACYHVTK